MYRIFFENLSFFISLSFLFLKHDRFTKIITSLILSYYSWFNLHQNNVKLCDLLYKLDSIFHSVTSESKVSKNSKEDAFRKNLSRYNVSYLLVGPGPIPGPR